MAPDRQLTKLSLNLKYQYLLKRLLTYETRCFRQLFQGG